MKFTHKFETSVLLFDGKALKVLDTPGLEWPARSGPWGNGPAPEGEYVVARAVELPDTAPGGFRDPAGNEWWAAMTPAFVTERQGLGIHPDGGVEGTLGCIGIIGTDTASCRDWLTKAVQPILLYVRYA